MVLRTPFTNSSRLLGGVLLGQLHRFDEHDGHGDVGRAVNSQVASRRMVRSTIGMGSSTSPPPPCERTDRQLGSLPGRTLIK
jgi:hypothetical protein